MKKISWYLFFLVGVTQIVSTLIDAPLLTLVSKPLIMLSLMACYVLNTSQRSAIFLAAMFFCWLGDVLLMGAGELFFMGGLVAFLTGHVLYIFSYRQMRNQQGEELLGPQKARFSLPIILAGTGLVVILFPTLGPLKIPVMIYALVITLMCLTALFRFGKTSKQSFVLLFIGALLFMVSDSILAINKFMQPVTGAGFYIMSTYILAQYLIVKGALAHRA